MTTVVILVVILVIVGVIVADRIMTRLAAKAEHEQRQRWRALRRWRKRS